MTTTILLYGVIILLFAIFLLLLRIHSKIADLILKNELSCRAIPEIADKEKDSGETYIAPGSAFEEFLNESPERRSMNKKDQFEAYRKWRAEKGLNWNS